MDTPMFERRVGERREVEGVEIGWHYGIPGATPEDPVEVIATTGDLVDVSVTGALIVAPHTSHVWLGCIVGVEFRGFKDTVAIRRIDRIFHERDFRLYGIEFTSPNSELAKGVSDAFLARHSRLPRWRDPVYRDFAPPVAAPSHEPPPQPSPDPSPEPAPVASDPPPDASSELPAAIDAGSLGGERA
ncbi:MAG: hypothetical protein JWM89_4020 [Acidimicrobiales bacterium]|nr:hypothetical protein [Acidimicrobiales bacterium]